MFNRKELYNHYGRRRRTAWQIFRNDKGGATANRLPLKMYAVNPDIKVFHLLARQDRPNLCSSVRLPLA